MLRTLSLPSPAALHAAAGSRNIWSLPDWHIHYWLSFIRKQSCLLAFEKIMLRNLLPATPSLVSEIYLADLSGKSHSWFPCASFQSKRDSIPFCKYWKKQVFYYFPFYITVTLLIVPSSFRSISLHSFWSAIPSSILHLSHTSHQFQCQSGRSGERDPSNYLAWGIQEQKTNSHFTYLEQINYTSF